MDHSIVQIKASEVYPKKSCEKTDPNIHVNFSCVYGEYVEFLGKIYEGTVALSNYRLIIINSSEQINIPLGLIDYVEIRDMFYLHLFCKDGHSCRITFITNEECNEWHRKLSNAISSLSKIEDVFAFCFYVWCAEESCNNLHKFLKFNSSSDSLQIIQEFERLDFARSGNWKITHANCDYKLCETYPKYLIIPNTITDSMLENVARFRSSRRFPAIIWRHSKNGAVIARCSQPEVGWLGWRSSEDEELMKAISKACANDAREKYNSNKGKENGDSSLPVELDLIHEPKILIMDARSYTTAIANRARGGGCEYPEYYPNCDIQFMNLANIHSIRKSFQSLRQLCSLPPEQTSLLEGTKWFHHMSGLLQAAVMVVTSVHKEGRPVVVHCSDGWDRTPQIVSLSELMLDPFYRTFEGFQVLVIKEWLEFGHKFSDRCGQGLCSDDLNERCPVFLQWLDCVHQLLHQFPCCFEFNQTYLVKLVHHTYSNLFGTFLCNSIQEKAKMSIGDHTYSVWSFLRANPTPFLNYLYCSQQQPIIPKCYIRDLILWSDVYLPKEGRLSLTSEIPVIWECEMQEEEPGLLRVKSCVDLITTIKEIQDEIDYQRHRRSSDPLLHESELNSSLIRSSLETNELVPHIASSSPNKSFHALEMPRQTKFPSNKSIITANSEKIISHAMQGNDLNENKLNTNENNFKCITCHSNRKLLEEQNSQQTSEVSSHIPVIAPASLNIVNNSEKQLNNNNFKLNLDGMPIFANDIQSRLQQIHISHLNELNVLRSDISQLRLALSHQILHQCSHDENAVITRSLAESPGNEVTDNTTNSTQSDIDSWETIDEKESQPILWIPDHAVSHCMGCNKEFWLGKRKHHCRNCGNVFCSQCSSYFFPVAKEQLYDPVRVCRNCSHMLEALTHKCRQENGELGTSCETHDLYV